MVLSLLDRVGKVLDIRATTETTDGSRSMRMSNGRIEFSASDLSGFLSCVHLTALDLAVARGARKPPTWTDPVLIALRERGLEHERGYVDALRAQGLSVADL